MSSTPANWLSVREQRAWRAWLEADRLLFDRLDRDLQRDAGMSLADFEVLVRVSEAPGAHLRMSELADETLFSRSRLSHAVTRLEALGWLRRQSCPTDGRGTLAGLTACGRAALEAAAATHVAAVRRYVFDALDPGEVEQLEHLGTRIRSRLGPGSADTSACPSLGANPPD
jgi:DNA-binding MarR family transcriptional regulator